MPSSLSRSGIPHSNPIYVSEGEIAPYLSSIVPIVKSDRLRDNSARLRLACA